MELSNRTLKQMENAKFFTFIRNVRTELGDEELIPLLKIHSAAVGRGPATQRLKGKRLR